MDKVSTQPREGNLFSPHYEELLLGGFLYNPQAAFAEYADVTPDYFSAGRRVMFEALREMHKAGEVIDPHTLDAYLKETGRIKKAGGPLAVLEIKCVSAPTAASGAAMVREKYRERCEIEIGGKLAAGDITGAEAESRLAELRGNASSTAQGTTELLAKCRYDVTAPPPAPVALYSLGGRPIATRENLMVIQAKMKAGKSACVGAMIAATMDNPNADCLGFASSNPQRLAVLHFDTEQSRFDHHRLVSFSVRRADRTQPPSWLYSYYLKGCSVPMSRRMVREAMRLAAAEFGGIHSVIIDGIGDLCADVNDAAEANALVAEMEALAMQYETLVVCVLHENHGSDSGKTRGHLGSQLARKAETNLRLEKDDEGVTVMFADTSRSVHIAKKDGVCFHWCDEAKAHVSTVRVAPADRERAELEQLAGKCFANTDSMPWSELKAALQRITGRSESHAERAIRSMAANSVITRRGEGYVRA